MSMSKETICKAWRPQKTTSRRSTKQEAKHLGGQHSFACPFVAHVVGCKSMCLSNHVLVYICLYVFIYISYIYILIQIYLPSLYSCSYLFYLVYLINSTHLLIYLRSGCPHSWCRPLFYKMDRVCHKTNLLQALAALSTHVNPSYAVHLIWSNRSNLFDVNNVTT